MNFTVSIPISGAEKRELSQILGCTQQQIAEKLKPYLEAAGSEYLTMFLGKRVFRRGSDMLEHRLFVLIEKAFNGRIPDEQTVSQLFQTTTTESRSLIRSIMSKYQYQLKTAIDETVKAVLTSAQKGEQDSHFTMNIYNANIVAEMNREIASIDGNLPPVRKKRSAVSTFEIAPSSYNRLCTKYGLQTRE